MYVSMPQVRYYNIAEFCEIFYSHTVKKYFNAKYYFMRRQLS